MFEETPADAWRHRYGTEPPEGLPDLARFLNHRSVRQFRPDPIPEATIAGLVAAAQSAATSSNLQLWSAVSVQSPERRAEIARVCADQRQIHNAAWFFCFLADHHRLRTAAAPHGEACAGLGYNEFFTMAVIDAALAAERMVAAAENMGIATCYIGALRNDVFAVRDLLGLPSGTVGLFGLCLGWPVEDAPAEIKPRLPQSAVWFRERYGPADTAEYDARMAAFYAAQGMKGDATWSMRSGRRTDANHMTGREALRPFLDEQGLDQR